MNDEKKNLIVDLDNTLLKTDMFYESLFAFLKRNPANIFKFFIYLIFKGKSQLKDFISINFSFDVKNLPYNYDLIDWIKKNKHQYNQIYLFSGSNNRIVKKISSYLGLFDLAIGSSAKVNMTNINKLEEIRKYSSGLNFDYIGDSGQDVIIWKEAQKAWIVTSTKFKKFFFEKVYKIKFNDIFYLKFFFGDYLKLFRFHQWPKNILLFTHFILIGKSLNLESFFNLTIGFLAMSFLASTVYLINDAFDVEADRFHPVKKNRPLASGKVSFSKLPFLICLNMIILFFLCLTLKNYLNFIYGLFIYFLLTTIYSIFLKYIKFVDCFILGLFFAFRVFLGSLLDKDHAISFDLLIITFFIFSSLGFLKRYIELRDTTRKKITSIYHSRNINIVMSLGFLNIIFSILYLFASINHINVLISSSSLIFLPILIFYLWIFYLWVRSIKFGFDYDPVSGSLRDGISIFLGFLFFFFFLLAKL